MSGDLARLGALVADDLAGRGYAGAGIVLRMAQQLATDGGPLLDDEPGGACPVCGEPIVQPSTGRPKRYCSDRCRFRARNST